MVFRSIVGPVSYYICPPRDTVSPYRSNQDQLWCVNDRGIHGFWVHGVLVTVCVFFILHITPLFLPVDIQHITSVRADSSILETILERSKLCGHRPTTQQRYNVVLQ